MLKKSNQKGELQHFPTLEEMFPFGENPLEPTFKKPSFQIYDQIQNPILPKNDDPPFFPNFPSPFFDEHELPLNQILPKQANPTPAKKDYSPKPKQIKQKPDAPVVRRRGMASASASAPRKRTGKKDRHSKICTAQGIRDRRMRLSLQVARKFFDLQDLLGYDKASKTIEWLFTKSKKAIKELAMDGGGGGGGGVINLVSLSDGRSESFMSEDCEVMSGIEENCSNNEIKEGLTTAEVDESFEKKPKAKKATNLKESREKARARARCRTEEKMMGKRVEEPSPTNHLEQLGSAAAAAAAEDYAPQPSDVGTIEKLLGNSCDPSNNFMGFLGNWDFLSNDRINYAIAGTNPNSIFAATASPDFPLFHQ